MNAGIQEWAGNILDQGRLQLCSKKYRNYSFNDEQYNFYLITTVGMPFHANVTQCTFLVLKP